MGCGESKHDVATGNTISQKSSKKFSFSSKKTKDLEIIPETHVVKGSESNDNSTNNANNTNENSSKVVGDGDQVKEGGEEGVVAAGEGRLISKESPDRYFSSRKSNEAIEAILNAAAAAEILKEAEKAEEEVKEDKDLVVDNGEGKQGEEDKKEDAEQIKGVDSIDQTLVAEADEKSAAEDKKDIVLPQEDSIELATQETKSN